MNEQNIISMLDLEKRYAQFLSQSSAVSLNLADWLKCFGTDIRPLVPGELCFIMGDTGTGKSLALQQIAACTSEICLFFELELPGTLLFERWQQHCHTLTDLQVQDRYLGNPGLAISQLEHIYTCDQTRLTRQDMEAYIDICAKKAGTPPRIVFVDYIGLMQSGGKSRYERMSSAAEELKVMAKIKNVVVIAATQMARPEDNDPEPDLHSARDSGMIENSCGLLLGLWRDAKGGHIKVLKNTKGKSGNIYAVDVDGEHMTMKGKCDPVGGELAPWER